jgi:adenylate kinase family enzyme
MIFGRPGSGKSTFALKLHKETGIPLHHLDKHFFEKNWVERDYNEFLSIQRAMVDGPKWIIDGNSTKSLEMRYSRADVVLYFNYPAPICLVRLLKRLLRKNPEIQDRAEGCNEKIRLQLIKYMWGFNHRVEKQLHEYKIKYPHVTFIEIDSDKSLISFNALIKGVGV